MEPTVGGRDAAIEPPRMGLRRVGEREPPCISVPGMVLRLEAALVVEADSTLAIPLPQEVDPLGKGGWQGGLRH